MTPDKQTRKRGKEETDKILGERYLSEPFSASLPTGDD